MGILVDRRKAMETPCTCYKIGAGPESPENLLCFSPGIVGSLSNTQDEDFCVERVVKPPSEEYSEHIGKFKRMGKIMDVCLEKDIEDFKACVIREAEKIEG